MSSIKAAVVIPIYKENLNVFEQISLQQVQKILGNYPIIFFAPENKNFSYTENFEVVHFPQQYFKNVDSYSALMTSVGFYEKFLSYDYILVYQLDAFVFSDKLEYFCSLGYDYIGAAWTYIWIRKVRVQNKNIVLRVGNGGFSLRNVKSCRDILRDNAVLVEKLHALPEDLIFSYFGFLKEFDFEVAPVNIAQKFSTEYFIERIVKKNHGELPFGCHAWHNFSANFYIKIFRQFGFDLNPFKNQLQSNDLNGLRNSLVNIIFQRLNRRLQKAQSIIRYLPTKNFASIRVIRNPYTNFILNRLIVEDNKIADKIYLYDKDEIDILVHDLIPEKQPHLLIANGDVLNDKIIADLNNNGISYGKRLLSFWREYIKSCEEIFHNLGK